jgi:glutamine cyclotransferase
VTHDGARVWFATERALHALDPGTGATVRTLVLACDGGTAFDGRHLFQLAGGQILEIDPATGAIVASRPAPATGYSGLTWAEGFLWLGRYGDRQVLKLDPATGAVLRTLTSNRFVTGVTWVDGELWHATWEDGVSELRRIDPADGAVLARLALPPGVQVTGLEADGDGHFFCGGGDSGTVRVVRRPGRRRRGSRGPRRRGAAGRIGLDPERPDH